MAKFELGGPGPLVVNIIVNYCCVRVLLYVKLLKETEETRRFCHLFLIGDISIGRRGRAPAYAYGALAMFARSWLFCYDMLGYCITETCLIFLH